VTWTNIVGATKSTYTVAAADVAQKLRVNVTITSTHFATFVDPSPAGTGVANTSLANGSVGVDIVGSGAVTTVNTAKVGGVWGSPSPVLTYRWYACDTATAADCSLTNDPGFVPIVPAVTTASYTPPVAMAPNHFLQVRVTGSKPSYVPFTILSLPVQVKLLSKPSIITPPKVAAGLVGGTPIVGKVLTAGPSVTDVITTHAYSWQTCDDNPAGNCTGDVHWQAVGTGASYTVKPGDFTSDGRIRVVDTATKAGLGSSTGDPLQSSLDYPVAVGALVNSVLPKATITPSAATVTPGTWTPSATFDYQWYVDGNPALTGPTLFTPPAAASLSVAVTAHAPGYADKTVTQIVRKGVVPTATGAVTGTFLVGSPLTAPATPITFPGPISSVVTTYMWYSNGALIAGQTAQTFTPSGAYVGKTITAHTTIATAQYATVTANDTGPIGQLITTATAATGTPVIVSNTGHLLPGATLSVPVTSYSPTGLTFAYKWEYFNGTSWVLRAATPTVLLTTADAGRDIRVTVTATKLGYLPSVLTAPTASIGYLGPLAALTGPTLTGAGVVGSPLAIAVTWNTPPTTVAYQWYRNGVPLPGATGVSFTPTATSLGDEIRATVTVTKPGYANQTFGSQIVQVGIAAAPIGTIPVIAVPTVPARAPLGSPKVGDTLTASTGVWNVDGLTFHYDWRGKYAGDPTAYPLGTGPTYTPTVIDGPLVSITVTVTATRDGYAPSLAYTSVATKPVVP